MKKAVSFSLVLIMLLTCFSAVGFAASEINETTNTYYVAPNGSDSNDGVTPQTAFASLDHAKNTIRLAKQENPNQVYTVKILAGNYKMESTVSFTSADSGSAKYPIVYEAYGNGPVNFKGSVTLSSQNEHIQKVENSDILNTVISEAAKQKLMQIDLNALGIKIPTMPNAYGYGKSSFHPLRIYIDGQALTEARFPNVGEGYIPMSGINNQKTYKADGGYNINYADNNAPLSRTSLWDTQNRSIYISGTIAHEYAANHLRVKAFGPANKNIITDGYGSYETYVGKSYFYFTNVLEEIDVPGESYVDEENGIIYFYPYDGMENASIEIATLNQNMLQMANADYITFKNLNFGYTINKILNATNTDYLTIDGCEFAHTSSNAMVVNGTNITFKTAISTIWQVKKAKAAFICPVTVAVRI